MSYVLKFILNLYETSDVMFVIIFIQSHLLLALAVGKFLDWQGHYEPYRASFAFFGGLLALAAFLAFMSI